MPPKKSISKATSLKKSGKIGTMTDLKTEASGDVVSLLGPASLHSARIGTNDVEPTRVFVGESTLGS